MLLSFAFGVNISFIPKLGVLKFIWEEAEVAALDRQLDAG